MRSSRRWRGAWSNTRARARTYTHKHTHARFGLRVNPHTQTDRVKGEPDICVCVYGSLSLFLSPDIYIYMCVNI